MSEYRPNEETFLPNDEPKAQRDKPLAPPPAFTPLVVMETAYEPTRQPARYTPNEPEADEELRLHEMPVPTQSAPMPRRSGENPYAAPTWDEETFEREQPADLPNVASATPVRSNPYARPQEEVFDGDLSARFMPPPKFSEQLGQPSYRPEDELPMEPARPNVYRTRGVTEPQAPNAVAPVYRVDAEQEEPPVRGRKRRRKRMLRKLLVLLLALVLLAALGYWQRDWAVKQYNEWFGSKEIESVSQPAGEPTQAVVAYDAAPALQISEQAKRGVSAVSGTLDMQSYAVTEANVVTRVQTDQDSYDFYLFSAKEGKLLGYYDGLGAFDFLVCAADVYYIPQSPYLINAKGLALIDASRYQLSVGADAVLHPLINGWALISDSAGSTCNFINASGDMIGNLWFAKAFPFTGDATVAYVDTGNVSSTTDRYALYELTAQGEMNLWRHTNDLNDVLGSACGFAYLADGDLVRLDGSETSIISTDDVSAYLDCGALVVKDPQTGKFGLFVNGEQRYEYDYDSIEPVAGDVEWRCAQNGAYKQYSVANMAYPLPLSHYFVLRKGEQEEMVALSTTSVYPIVIE